MKKIRIAELFCGPEGGTHMYHYKFPRALTNRERASLQTFPLRYKFHGNKTSVRKQIGMAVPPLAAKAIFSNIKKCLRCFSIKPQRS